METPTSLVAANVRAELARSGRTQREFGEAIGVSQSLASKRLRGTIPFGIDELAKASAFLDVPLATLLDGVGSAA